QAAAEGHLDVGVRGEEGAPDLIGAVAQLVELDAGAAVAAAAVEADPPVPLAVGDAAAGQVELAARAEVERRPVQGAHRYGDGRSWAGEGVRRPGHDDVVKGELAVLAVAVVEDGADADVEGPGGGGGPVEEQEPAAALEVEAAAPHLVEAAAAGRHRPADAQ